MSGNFYIEIKGMYASLSEDGETLELKESKEDATPFPEETAQQIVAALSQNGVEQDMISLVADDA